MGKIEAANWNEMGLTALVTKPRRQPARPQMTALTTKAKSFQLAVRIPRLDDAISLVANARRVRPKRYLSPRSSNTNTTMTMIQIK